ncbi:uncharacterized protein BJ171DRAFT_587751 [Polychytrium aggregatum]|uniref:uncharacterized protein n=1 Tax=Polychytrium aggregatum TaxID=110093 RepID=UPI0022FDB19D|nr:uncharacterized protein BJ171DRAFT_587751 [Polychytrium aggregatum]KAI9193354.1 hypothetical protein BJ171DRAFT_587751 [Polychytrium aggregatum]
MTMAGPPSLSDLPSHILVDICRLLQRHVLWNLVDCQNRAIADAARSCLWSSVHLRELSCRKGPRFPPVSCAHFVTSAVLTVHCGHSEHHSDVVSSIVTELPNLSYLRFVVHCPLGTMRLPNIPEFGHIRRLEFVYKDPEALLDSDGGWLECIFEAPPSSSLLSSAGTGTGAVPSPGQDLAPTLPPGVYPSWSDACPLIRSLVTCFALFHVGSAGTSQSFFSGPRAGVPLSAVNSELHLDCDCCRYLVGLKIPADFVISDKVFTQLTDRSSRLKTLSVPHAICTDQSLQHIASFHRRLQDLTILSRSSSRITPHCLSEAVSQLHALKSIKLTSYCTNDDVLVAISRSCPGLLNIELNGGRSMTDSGIGALVNGCSGLVGVSLIGCGSLTDASLIMLGHGLPRLKKLDLSYCSQFTDLGFEALVDTEGNLERESMLEYLALDTSAISELLLTKILTLHCRTLLYLSLSYCTRVSGLEFLPFLKSQSQVYPLPLQVLRTIGSTVNNALFRIYIPALQSLRVCDIAYHCISEYQAKKVRDAMRHGKDLKLSLGLRAARYCSFRGIFVDSEDESNVFIRKICASIQLSEFESRWIEQSVSPSLKKQLQIGYLLDSEMMSILRIQDREHVADADNQGMFGELSYSLGGHVRSLYRIRKDGVPSLDTNSSTFKMLARWHPQTGRSYWQSAPGIGGLREGGWFDVNEDLKKELSVRGPLPPERVEWVKQQFPAFMELVSFARRGYVEQMWEVDSVAGASLDPGQKRDDYGSPLLNRLSILRKTPSIPEFSLDGSKSSPSPEPAKRSSIFSLTKFRPKSHMSTSSVSSSSSAPTTPTNPNERSVFWKIVDGEIRVWSTELKEEAETARAHDGVLDIGLKRETVPRLVEDPCFTFFDWQSIVRRFVPIPKNVDY